ncbi:MAG: hypothetical protein GKS01_18980 [Alphaproteobacteria bacterium]|nr:hypothetical protein [Alphaproteobacteria bacterium]
MRILVTAFVLVALGAFVTTPVDAACVKDLYGQALGDGEDFKKKAGKRGTNTQVLFVAEFWSFASNTQFLHKNGRICWRPKNYPDDKPIKIHITHYIWNGKYARERFNCTLTVRANAEAYLSKKRGWVMYAYAPGKMQLSKTDCPPRYW